MQHITLGEVKAKAKAAYDAGLLLAQGYPKRQPVFHYYEYRCAIGTALSAETHKEINRRQLNKRSIQGKGIISYSVEDDPGIFAIQCAHDRWLQWPGRENEQAFLALL